MSANPLFNSILKPRTGPARHLQVVNDHARLEENGSGHKSVLTRPRYYDRCRGGRSAKSMEPPDKRRKTDSPKTGSQNTELWDDDLPDFSQLDLENIDHMIIQSQQVAPDVADTGTSLYSRVTSPRALGRGTPRSHSAGDAAAFPYDLKGSSKTALRGDHVSTHGGQRSTVASMSVPDYSSRQTSGYGPSVSSSHMSSSYKSLQKSTEHKNTGNLPAHQSGAGVFQQLRQTHSTSTGISSGDASKEHIHELTKELEKYREELSYYKKEHENLKNIQYGKDGEIIMLRKSVAEKSNELAAVRQERSSLMDAQARERSDKEKALGKDVEKLQTLLQFKEQEIVELQGTCRKLEQKSRSSVSSGSESPRRPQSPRRLPRSPQVQHSPRQTASLRSPPSAKPGFPTQQSFLAHEQAIHLGRAASDSSKSAGTNGKQESSSSSVQPASSSSALASSSSLSSETSAAKPSARSHKMQLPLAVSCGGSGGVQLMGQLMKPTSICSSDASPAGFMGMLQYPRTQMDMSTLRLQRDATGQSFSPLRPKRCSSTPAASASSSSSSSSSSAGASVANVSSASLALPSSVQQLVVTKENYSLATHAMSSLLTSQSETDMSSETAILLLPLIEDYVNAYLTLVNSTMDIYSSSSQTPSLGSHGSLESSVETLTSSLQGLMQEGAAFANQLEDCALNALHTLHTLVNYSEEVCQALVSDNYRQIAMEPEAAATRSHEVKKKPNVQKLKSTRGMAEACTFASQEDKLDTSGPGYVDVSVTRIIRDLQLLYKVIQTANPLLPNGQPARSSIVETSLQILARIANVSQHAAIERLGSIFTLDILLQCFSEKESLMKSTFLPARACAVDLMVALITHAQLLTRLCSKSDDCLLLAMYNAAVSPLPDKSPLKLIFICKVLGFLSRLVSYHKSGSTILVESDCQCSVEVVKCIILMMVAVLQKHHLQATQDSLSALRSGASLLHALSQRDKLFLPHRAEVDHEYVELICGLDDLFRDNPHVEKQEVAAVRELWDFDQDYPDGQPESDEQAMEEEEEAESN